MKEGCMEGSMFHPGPEWTVGWGPKMAKNHFLVTEVSFLGVL